MSNYDLLRLQAGGLSECFDRQVKMSKANMKFYIYKDARGEHRWKLKSRTGRIVADSSEGYKTKQGVKRAITSIKAEIRTFDVPVVEKI